MGTKLQITLRSLLVSCKSKKGIVLIVTLVLISIVALSSTAISCQPQLNLKSASLDDILDGTHGGRPGILSCGTNTSFGIGTYTVAVTDDDDGDGDTMNDSNNTVIVTSTGTCPSSNARMVEMIIKKNSIGTLTAAVSFIDNDNGSADYDEVRINTNGTALITGLDTVDLSTTESDGPGLMSTE